MHEFYVFWVFLTQNGIGQNLTASALLGTPALLHLHKVLRKHHRERLAHAQELHDQQMRTLAKARVDALRLATIKTPKDSSERGPVQPPPTDQKK